MISNTLAFRLRTTQMAIQNINASDIQRITSGQVIIDMVSIVKELVENSIDARSSKIEIVFRNNGLDSIEIIDDGIGIGEKDFESVCLKHYTSKLTTFEQLSEVSTLGFRGEALSSLCSVSNIKITTCTRDNYPKATELRYNLMGILTNKKKLIGGIKGTSILVSDLFHNLPVRQKNLQKNVKKEFNKAISLLINYIIINPSIRFTVYNTNVKTNKKNLMMGTKGTANSTILDNVVNIFGSNGSYGLIPLDIVVEDMDVKFKLNRGEFPIQKKMNIQFKGYISNCSFGLGRSSGDRQYLFINRRPILLKKYLKTINEVYKSFNHVQFPVVILNLIIDTELLDINVTPDKRVIMIQNEDLINDVLRNEITNFFNNQNNVIPKNTNSVISLNKERNSITSQLIYKQNDKHGEENLSILEDTNKDGEIENNIRMKNASQRSEKKVEEKEDQNKLKENDKDKNDDEHKEDEGDEKIEPEDEKDKNDEKHEVEQGENLFEGVIVEKHEIDDKSEGDVKEYGDYKCQNVAAIEKGITDRIRNPEDRPLRKLDTLKVDLRVADKPVFVEEREIEMESEPLVSENDDEQQNERDSGKDSTVLEEANMKSIRVPGKRTRNTELFVSESESEVDFEYGINDDSSERTSQVIDLSTFKNKVSGMKKPLKQVEPVVVDNLKISIGDREVEERPVKRTRTMVSRNEITFNEDSSSTIKPAVKSYVHNLSTVLHVDLSETIVGIGTNNIMRHNQKEANSNIEIDNIESAKEAEEKLSYTILKPDFLKMKLIGQFNLGFILVTLNSSNNLFIVDQHASDEKYNFEKLTENTTFQNQTLVLPKIIELNAIDEMIVMDNLSVFKQNGFIVQVEENNQPGQCIKLVSLPVQKNVLFDISDFHELIHLINTHNSTNNDGLKCSKIRSLLAMRACRSSIMIGQHLNKKTMSRILTNLSKLDKPWNCPHGRPTMRHLIELQNWSTFKEDYQL